MLLLPLLALFALPVCFALTKEQTHEQLVKLAAASPDGVIKLDDRSYEMLTTTRRDWSSTIVFTALDPRRKCAPCRSFDPSYHAVAKAWTKAPAAERNSHFFAVADFDQSMSIFQKLGIQSAPVLHMYPAANGPRKPASGKIGPMVYNFDNGYDPQPLAEQLSKHTPVPIPYKPPVDYAKFIFLGSTALIAVAALRFISPIIKSRFTWAALCTIVVLVMTSGFMFNRIRGVPYTDGRGSWIAPGYQNQYGQETQVVAMIYGLLAGAFLMLTMVTPYQLSPKRQQAQVWLWTIVIFIMFSVLISLFRVKNRAYPFKLLL